MIPGAGHATPSAQTTRPTCQPANLPTAKQSTKCVWGRAGFLAMVLAREHWWQSVSMSGFARRRGSNIRGSGEHRAFGAPMNGNCTLWTLRVAWLKALSLLRFFVALDKEMMCRHAQWLTVIKKTSNLGRPLRSKAPTRH